MLRQTSKVPACLNQACWPNTPSSATASLQESGAATRLCTESFFKNISEHADGERRGGRCRSWRHGPTEPSSRCHALRTRPAPKRFQVPACIRHAVRRAIVGDGLLREQATRNALAHAVGDARRRDRPRPKRFEVPACIRHAVRRAIVGDWLLRVGAY